MSKDNFVWSDELVLLALDFAHHNGYHRFPQPCVEVFDEVKKQAMQSGYIYPKWITDHIEQSKQQSVNKDWEIISFKMEGLEYYHGCDGKYRNVNDIYTRIEANAYNSSNKITSVKRLSDGEVFRIGDIEGCGDKIASFEIRDGKMYAKFEHYITQYPKPISILKREARQPLFKTEDGVDIYENDTFAIVELPSYIVSKSFAIEGSRKHPNQLYFSTETQAQQYIEDNKPLLSYNGIMKYIGYTMRESEKVKLKELIKSKL